MTGPAAPVTEQDPEPSRSHQVTRSIGRAAVLIGALTAAARIIGFGRQVVFAHTVGNSCLGSAYTTANQVPNIIYDIVLGGALASIMVPVLAGPADRSGADPEAARASSQISSALLTWTVVLLVPASAMLALAAHPLISLLIPRLQGCARSEAIMVGSRMLVVFAPQILLYGLAVVLYGILQAHRRFAAPALAPLLSSLVVIAAYVAFVPLGGRHTTHLAGLSATAELTLSVGTTVGVAALVLTAAVPAFRLRLRPVLRFPDGVARRARSLAMVGIAALIAQDAAAVVVTRLANGHGGNGAVVLYSYAWQMFLVPYAVLAIPIAVSAFPVLSARAGAELAGSEVARAQFDATSAASTRGVLLVSWLGAALLAGAARPAARLFASHPGQAAHLALAFAAFAPGLVGYGLVACLSRVLLADGRNRAAAAAIAGGWLIVIAADVIAVELVAARSVVPVLGLGNSVGLAASAAALVMAVRRARGGGALRGTARAAAAGLAGAAVGAAAGAGLSAAVPVTGFLPNACVTLLACGCAVIAFGVTAYGLDGGDLRALAARARRRALP
ncbi:MAG TPA: lipid II flippase MurJ [Streptosporangiaceae bacterium]|nr:lipid II flippase MurJ [Streptosporangiaceae bacterium]